LAAPWRIDARLYAADMEPRLDVTELRLVVTAADYEEALRFYRDVLGLAEQAAFSSPGGRVTILQAGRATLELAARVLDN